MKNVLFTASLLVASSDAFVPASSTTASSTSALAAETSMLPPTPKSPRGPIMSQAIPFIERPQFLDGELAGDVGFDPLGLANNREQLWYYREAEVKHARLAMLAAAGWPISELLDRPIAEFFGVVSILDDGDRVPSLLNGGLEKVSPVWWGFCLGLTASIDAYGVQRARKSPEGYIPGDLGLRGFYPIDDEGQRQRQLAEIKHGRLAMMAVLGFSFQEYALHLGVIDETPFFFFPFTETAEAFLKGILQ